MGRFLFENRKNYCGDKQNKEKDFRDADQTS